MEQEALERGRVEGGRVLCFRAVLPGSSGLEGTNSRTSSVHWSHPQPRSMRPWWFPRPSMGLSQAPGGAVRGGSFWGPEADLLCQGCRGHKEGRSYV